MKAAIVFVGLLLAAVVESTLGPALGLLGSVPDVVLIIVVSWALVRGSDEGMVCGMLGGLAVGLLSGAPLGVHALALTLVGFIAGLGQGSPFISRLLVPLAFVVGATLLYDVALAIALRVLGWPLAPSPALVRVLLTSIVTNAVLMPFIYGPISHVVPFRGGLWPESR